MNWKRRTGNWSASRGEQGTQGCAEFHGSDGILRACRLYHNRQGSGNWFEVFTINRGSKDGIEINSPVITAYGLVGRVSEVNLFTSKVVSIIDMDSTVAARVSSSRDVLIVRGDASLRSSGLCRMDYISPDVDIMPGDVIETSGLGGIYPKGIIIGQVKDVIRNEGQFDSYAVISPVVDFKRLEEVIVLKEKP